MYVNFHFLLKSGFDTSWNYQNQQTVLVIAQIRVLLELQPWSWLLDTLPGSLDPWTKEHV